MPVPHSQEELSPPHTRPSISQGPALSRELDCRKEHAVLSNPITSDTSRAGTCPPGSSPLCSHGQPAMLCNRAQEQQGIFLSTDLSTVLVPVCTRLQTCTQLTHALTLLLRLELGLSYALKFSKAKPKVLHYTLDALCSPTQLHMCTAPHLQHPQVLLLPTFIFHLSFSPPSILTSPGLLGHVCPKAFPKPFLLSCLHAFCSLFCLIS